MVKVKRAVVSVSNKTGVVDLCRHLAEDFGVQIISSGGTAAALAKEGVPVTEVSQVTNFPEMLDGRVKTIHPVIAAGILADRRKDAHMAQLEAAGIEPIDLIVVNLYPFAETIAKPGVTLDEAIENIDIGGPTLIRAASKNFEGVAVVVSPTRYEEILAEMKANDGALSRDTRFNLAVEAFEHTAAYDETIYEYLAPDEGFKPQLKLVFEKIQDLRYGENPHQKAAYYREENAPPHSLVYAQQLHGQELSYNNILDMDAAWGLVQEFTVPAAAVVKHANPCGCALGKDLYEAYEKAFAGDPVSAFGGIVALNRVVDQKLAEKLSETFLEVILAPAYLEEALEVLTKKKNVRIMCMGEDREPHWQCRDLRRVDGGLLVQDCDKIAEDRKDMKVVSKKKPSDAEWGDLLFAWRVAKHVHSNAIVLARDLMIVGVGAGQMSRVDSTFMSGRKAGKKRATGAVLASDAFFPFRDGIDQAAKVGAAAIIQPGGSMRDEEVITAADEHGMAMIFTGRRHFKH